MKEFKKWFDKEKIKYPYRPINEIDCGMGWRAALEEVLKEFPIEGYANNPIRRYISEQLLNNQTDNNTD